MIGSVQFHNVSGDIHDMVIRYDRDKCGDAVLNTLSIAQGRNPDDKVFVREDQLDWLIECLQVIQLEAIKAKN